MKKYVVIFLFGFSAYVCSEGDLEYEIKQVMSGGGSRLFVHVGDGTKKILLARGGAVDECEIQIEDGDAMPPVGNGKAMIRAFVRCPSFDLVGLRLRPESKKYHIVGFWTVR